MRNSEAKGAGGASGPKGRARGQEGEVEPSEAVQETGRSHRRIWSKQVAPSALYSRQVALSTVRKESLRGWRIPVGDTPVRGV